MREFLTSFIHGIKNIDLPFLTTYRKFSSLNTLSLMRLSYMRYEPCNKKCRNWFKVLFSSSPSISHGRKLINHCMAYKKYNNFREAVKFYFADFVHKGGGGTPQIRNPLFAEKVCKRGGGGTPQIRNLFFGPKSGVSFFFSKKHNF